MTTGQHDDTTTQIHDDTTTRQKPPPHGHTQGWRSDIETGGRLQRWEMAQTTMDISFGPYGECIFFFFSFIFTDTNACLLHIQLLIYMLCGMETGGRLWCWEMAQTMPDTSFGPCGECFFFPIRFYSECIFFFHLFLLILMHVYCIHSF